MDSLIAAIPFGLIIRSLFAGGFFVLSYSASRGAGSAIPQDAMVLIAAFSGFAAYAFHRALLYPFVECWLDSDAVRARRQRRPWIRLTTLERLVSQWGLACKRKADWARHITTWADLTNFAYVSAQCVVWGMLAGAIAANWEENANCWLIALAIVFAVAGYVSDRRLRTVLEYILKHVATLDEPADEPQSN